MEIQKVIEILKNEQECVIRQNTPKCRRWEHEGCLKCDLCQHYDEEIIEAYEDAITSLQLTDTVISALAKTIVELGYSSFEEFMEDYGGGRK